MRYGIFFACIALAQAMAQQRIQIKKPESIERQKGQQEAAAKIDIAAFQKSLAPIEKQILDNNRVYVEKAKVANEQAETVLKEIQLTQRTEIQIADDTDVMAVLNPTDPYAAKLSYATTSGIVLWTKTIDFSKTGFDLGRGRTWTQISSNGKRVIVYGYQYESIGIIAVYDQNGTVITENKPYAQLAPSGNYFFGNSVDYTSSHILIYDAKFTPLSLTEEIFSKADGNEYRYSYRIFENDLLVVVITEAKVELKKTVTNKTLVLYDLKHRQLITRESLLLPNKKTYSVSPEDRRMQVENKKFIVSLLEDNNDIVLLLIDLESKQSRRIPGLKMNSLALADDGAKLLISQSEKVRGQLRFSLNYLIVDIASAQSIDSFPCEAVEPIKSFKYDQHGLKVITGSHGIMRYYEYSSEHELQHAISGWFQRKGSNLFIPVNNDQSEIELVKLTRR